MNGTYEPSHSILEGKVESRTLHAKGMSENNNSSILTLLACYLKRSSSSNL